LKLLAIVCRYVAICGTAKTQGIFKHRIEDRSKVARRGVDDLQYAGGRGLLGESLITLTHPISEVPLRFVPFGSAFGKLTFEIGYPLRGIG
jgi:hypothetical protein